jgi:hypothetical protein
MTSEKSTQHLPYFARNVLQELSRTKQEAAWELLAAIKELFPDRFQELRGIGDRLVDESDPDVEEDHPINVEAANRFFTAVAKWTKECRITSKIVNDVAADVALRKSIEPVFFRGYFDQHGKHVEPPSLEDVDPHDEGREQFIERATRHYDALVEFYRDGTRDRLGVVKRDLQHFRYLAARLVGDYSWAELANQETPLGLPKATESSISEGARQAAALVDIDWTTKRGQRKGGRRRPRR